MRRLHQIACAGLLAFAGAALAQAQASGNRVELSRVDLAGVPGMEVVSSLSEYKKGEELPRHFHHGVEAGYVIQGTSVQVPGREPTQIPTGRHILNLRDIAHAGYVIVGETSLKLFTVHVVDKGKPLYDTPHK